MTIFEGILLFHTLPCLITTLIAIQIMRSQINITLWDSKEWTSVSVAGALYPILWFYAIFVIFATCFNVLKVMSLAVVLVLSRTEIPLAFWKWRKHWQSRITSTFNNPAKDGYTGGKNE